MMGKKEMRADVDQAAPTSNGTVRLVIHSVYCSGSRIRM